MSGRRLPATLILTREPAAGWTGGVNPTGLTGCHGERAIGRTVHLDRDLAHTKRTTQTGSPTASRSRPRSSLADSRAVALGRRLRGLSGVRVGLVVLVGLTTWAVASVSVWMVPAYLALMVLIFVTPQGRRPSQPASEPGTDPMQFGVTDIDENLRVDRTAGSDHIRPVDEPLDTSMVVDETANELSGSIPDSAGSGATKPRRGRSRA